MNENGILMNKEVEEGEEEKKQTNLDLVQCGSSLCTLES